MSAQELPERDRIPEAESTPIPEAIIPFRAEPLNAGWCEGEIAGFISDDNIPGEKRKSHNLAMLSATASPRRHFDHSQLGCQAKTDQSAPKHACYNKEANHICSYPCPTVLTDTVQLASIINDDCIPLLTWKDEGVNCG
jgi:hypothetical protein